MESKIHVELLATHVAEILEVVSDREASEASAMAHPGWS